MKRKKMLQALTITGYVLMAGLAAMMVYGIVSAAPLPEQEADEVPGYYLGDPMIVNLSHYSEVYWNNRDYSDLISRSMTTENNVIAWIIGWDTTLSPHSGAGTYMEQFIGSDLDMIYGGWTNNSTNKIFVKWLGGSFDTTIIETAMLGMQPNHYTTNQSWTAVYSSSLVDANTEVIFNFQVRSCRYTPDTYTQVDAEFFVYPLYYGVEVTPVPTATSIPAGQGWCADLPAETPVSAYDPQWLAQCSDCVVIPEATEEGPRPLKQYMPTYELPEMQLTCEPGKCTAPTKAPTPTIPAICATPPVLRDDTPVVPIGWSDLPIRQGECYIILPQSPGGDLTIPEFAPLGIVIWEEFSLGWEGWQVCVNWVTLPELRVLDFEIPSSLLVLAFVGVMVGILV